MRQVKKPALVNVEQIYLFYIYINFWCNAFDSNHENPLGSSMPSLCHHFLRMAALKRWLHQFWLIRLSLGLTKNKNYILNYPCSGEPVRTVTNSWHWLQNELLQIKIFTWKRPTASMSMSTIAIECYFFIPYIIAIGARMSLSSCEKPCFGTKKSVRNRVLNAGSDFKTFQMPNYCFVYRACCVSVCYTMNLCNFADSRS